MAMDKMIKLDSGYISASKDNLDIYGKQRNGDAS
jgi:hypothetical protein